MAGSLRRPLTPHGRTKVPGGTSPERHPRTRRVLRLPCFLLAAPASPLFVEEPAVRRLTLMRSGAMAPRSDQAGREIVTVQQACGNRPVVPFLNGAGQSTGWSERSSTVAGGFRAASGAGRGQHAAPGARSARTNGVEAVTWWTQDLLVLPRPGGSRIRQRGLARAKPRPSALVGRERGLQVGHGSSSESSNDGGARPLVAFLWTPRRAPTAALAVPGQEVGDGRGALNG